MKRIKVLVVEDHPVARAGIRSALEACDRVTVLAEAGSGEEAVDLAHKLLPDVVLMDIELPGMDGLDVAEVIRAEMASVKVILLSVHADARYVERATHAGVCGYLLKNAPVEKLVESVVAVGDGGAARTAQSLGANAMGQSGEALTERDRTILKLIADGKCNKEIAGQMGIKVVTVESYRETLKRKLNIRTTAGLVQYAVAMGLVTNPASTEAGSERV